MVSESRHAARAEGLDAVLAAVRPTLKDRYPLIPIESYLGWRRADGSHFDPWLRLHERAGGKKMRTIGQLGQIRCSQALLHARHRIGTG